MCKILKVSRGSIYYNPKETKINSSLENEIIRIFRGSRNNYGTRKIKVELEKLGYLASRRKISEIMKKYKLISNYTVKQFKVKKQKANEDNAVNIVRREFNRKDELEVVVSDLTYINVNGKWNYVCILLDLYNREIVGYSAGEQKSSELVLNAFKTVKTTLKNIKIFHTDRGSEFKNQAIEELLKKKDIKRSLSKKGCPYDNAVAEATFKIFKTEFVFNKIFKNIEELKLGLFDYVNWYNNVRIHGSLNYMTPIEFKYNVRQKIV